jgi:hypothetical protein
MCSRSPVLTPQSEQENRVAGVMAPYSLSPREETVSIETGRSHLTAPSHSREAASLDAVQPLQVTTDLASYHRTAIQRAPTGSHGLAALYLLRSVWRAEAATLTDSQLSLSSSSQAAVGLAVSALRAHT